MSTVGFKQRDVSPCISNLKIVIPNLMQDQSEEGPPAGDGPMPVPDNADKETDVNVVKEAPAVERFDREPRTR